MRLSLLLILFTSLTFGTLACSTNQAGITAGGSGTFANAITLTTFGTADPDSGFSSNGRIGVNFLTEDADGNAVLAQGKNLSLGKKLQLALTNALIRSAMAATGDVRCVIESPAGMECSLDGVATAPALLGVDQRLASGVLMDSSGSMTFNDPARLRVAAASNYFEVLSENSFDNLLAVYDFTTDNGSGDWLPTAPFAATRLIYDWQNTTPANVLDAQVEIELRTLSHNGTPLFQSVLELCQSVAANPAIPIDYLKTILILSDGEDTEGGALVSDIQQCLQDNNIVANVIGLGDDIPEVALRAMANANGGIFAKANSADALTPLFQAMAGAATEGYNIAQFTLSNPELCTSQIRGRIEIEGTDLSGEFEFACP